MASSQNRSESRGELKEELWTGVYSGKAMVRTWFLIRIANVGLVVIAFAFQLILIAIPIIWAIGGLVYAGRQMGVYCQLTSQRFIHQAGNLTRKTDWNEVIDLDDASFTPSPDQRFCGVGKIV